MRKLGMEVSVVSAIAEISRSGYYGWLEHADEPEWDYGDYLLVKDLFDKGKAKWGSRTITMKLKENHTPMNHKKVRRIMNKYDLVTKIRRRNPYKMIMKKSLGHRTFENILNREFRPAAPLTVFSTDITYIPLNYRFAYLSVVKDICSGEVVAWNLGKTLEMDLVMDTIKTMAGYANAMIHSDQGFHYTNPLYAERVRELGMIQSMSRKGNCIDNAPIESFFGHLKDEIAYRSAKTFEELYAMIEEYMRYYNHERRQWELKKMTPIEYRNHLLAG